MSDEKKTESPEMKAQPPAIVKAAEGAVAGDVQLVAKRAKNLAEKRAKEKPKEKDKEK